EETLEAAQRAGVETSEQLRLITQQMRGRAISVHRPSERRADSIENPGPRRQGRLVHRARSRFMQQREIEILIEQVFDVGLLTLAELTDLHEASRFEQAMLGKRSIAVVTTHHGMHQCRDIELVAVQGDERRNVLDAAGWHHHPAIAQVRAPLTL